ncbi:hypothetical protein [Roseateles terrae]|uniref:Uncharacterized protein n=1 Tax=Roseateles terrae TaxID=431060 RepID=A0ABR6GWX0_9BURK|nr:hypothetical protein [Roseateles terrae]MBB3196598.1 hypothetical protein [Roseateles terrae]OWQ84857.1 hypothetical protein CDN98_17490 [Roseateles terrae]
MDWLTYHKASEAYATKAHTALSDGRNHDAEKLFRRAAAAEERALLQLNPAKIRTFGITAVSAASLWFKGRDLPRAARLVQRCLTQPDLLPPARAQLEELRSVIPSVTAQPASVTPPPSSDAPAGHLKRWAWC